MSEPALSSADEYTAFCLAVDRLAGIDLGQYKRPQMERRIRSLAERRGHASLAAYLAALRRQEGLLDEFLDRVTINVSQLWRNPDQWRGLAETALPDLAARGRIAAWSAGCSYGAEAYTVAALCCQLAPDAALEVHGTDVDRRMIERARRGRFSDADARSAPARQLGRWFDREAGGWRARPELRLLTRFAVADLLRDPIPENRFDLVLCRNVVIYFTEPVRDRLHRRLTLALRPGGYLMVGSSERVCDPRSLGLEPVQPFIYRRSG